MATLDFRNHQKTYLNLTLPDEKETSLKVMQPTKELFTKMTEMSTRVGSMAGSDLDALNEVYEVCAELISRNKEGITFTKEELEGVLDFEDIVVFLRAYSTFVSEIVFGKN